MLSHAIAMALLSDRELWGQVFVELLKAGAVFDKAAQGADEAVKRAPKEPEPAEPQRCGNVSPSGDVCFIPAGHAGMHIGYRSMWATKEMEEARQQWR